MDQKMKETLLKGEVKKYIERELQAQNLSLSYCDMAQAIKALLADNRFGPHHINMAIEVACELYAVELRAELAPALG